MIIEESDFKIEGEDTFDLYLIKIVNAKDPDKKREEFRNIGHDMAIENCIKRIVIDRVNKKQDVYSLKEFLNSYKKEVKKIASLLDVHKG
ncbi:MAG: hypothetical protein PF569_01750 [Candidatus Woesearchaeota archaeon]|jgi:hypothetical protein|nr:hypothetical protein [Candidatus Woesearchaeota archaeon]